MNKAIDNVKEMLEEIEEIKYKEITTEEYDKYIHRFNNKSEYNLYIGTELLSSFYNMVKMEFYLKEDEYDDDEDAIYVGAVEYNIIKKNEDGEAEVLEIIDVHISR